MSKKVKVVLESAKKLSLLSVIKAPVVTEKSTKLSENGQVVFYVEKNASKGQIKDAVEQVFNVKVKAVNTILLKGKQKNFKGRSNIQQDKKKAIVSLMDGQKIDLGTGI